MCKAPAGLDEAFKGVQSWFMGKETQTMSDMLRKCLGLVYIRKMEIKCNKREVFKN